MSPEKMADPSKEFVGWNTLVTEDRERLLFYGDGYCLIMYYDKKSMRKQYKISCKHKHSNWSENSIL